MSIALSIGNNLTTNGVFTADAVNNTSVTNVTDFASVPGGGALKLLSTQTASASASIEFSLDDSYDSYVFKIINCHPATDNVDFEFQGSTNNGSSYGVSITSTSFRSHADSAGGSTQVVYLTDQDLANSTSFQKLSNNTSGDNDDGHSCTIHLFSPSSNTFVKHFITTSFYVAQNDSVINRFEGGYFNTTSPITNLKFQMSSGNIDAGIIKMYGVV